MLLRKLVYASGLLLLAFSASYADNDSLVLIETEAFDETGGWVVDQQFMDQMGSPYLLAHGLGVPVVDAQTKIQLNSPGDYRVWVRTRDWVAPWNAPGAPGKFQIIINGKALDTTFGTEGESWHWQDGGMVSLGSEAEVKLHDLTGFEGRCDAVLLSKNSDFQPPDSGQELDDLRGQLLGWDKTPEEGGQYDLVVVGGGIAGTSAAITAARLGLKVALIQDRPVLGGNGSSEVRVWPQGFTNHEPYPRVGDVVNELVPYVSVRGVAEVKAPIAFDDRKKTDLALAEKNLTLLLEQRVNDANAENGIIQSVIAQHTRSGRRTRVSGKLFLDSTGDGVLGALVGADFEFSKSGLMGTTNLWDVGEVNKNEHELKCLCEDDENPYSLNFTASKKPQPFPRCPWAVDLSDVDFPGRAGTKTFAAEGLKQLGNWFWESGFNRDTIEDAEWIRDQNFRAMYGAWDVLKNLDGMHPNHRLKWAAYIAGKRESRRLMGDVVLSADDFRDGTKFEDAAFPCTWHIDVHSPHPKYFKEDDKEAFFSTFTRGKEHHYKGPYWAPYRCLYSRNINNLFMAGRDISVTHEGLGPVRVMRTCGMMGEIVGMAASVCDQHNCLPREVYKKYLPELKQLMKTGVGKPVSVPTTKWPNQPVAQRDLIFEEVDGLVAVEAEHFFKQTLTNKRSFHLTHGETPASPERKEDPNHSDTASGGAYLEILPDTRRTHHDKLIGGENFSNIPGKLAVVSYKVHFNNPGRYYVWVRAYSTGSEDNGLHVGLNGKWPASGQRLQWCEGKHQWRWESRQRTKQKHCGEPHKIFLDIEKSGVHTISFSMREDGFEFDRWLMTKDREFKRPSDAGPETRVRSGELPGTYPIVAPKSVLDGKPVSVIGEFKRWHKMTWQCEGPQTGENANPNPFTNFRFNATFKHLDSGKTYKVPGYYAADGKSADSSAKSGNIWHVHFSPDKVGTWKYEFSFRKGPFIATIRSPKLGASAGFFDGQSGTFEIAETDKQGVDFRAHGRLQYVGEHYLKFAGTGDYFLKCGADAPENLLAYADFDGNFKKDGHGDQFVKTWEPHVKDWKEGDPTWAKGKGKGLIGAVNYLVSKRLNAMSFLTLNIKGDDKNVFPYINYNERKRFDVSKLAQWERVFEHAQQNGIFLHFKTQEHENQGLLDNGGLGFERKLYYRELIARFGHHLALNWNLCEESGEWGKQVTPTQTTPNRQAMAQYFHDHDPYQHLVVIHNGNPFFDLLGDKSKLTGASVQTNRQDFGNVHGAILKWRNQSAKAGKPWVVSCDEPGDAQFSLVPDAINPDHDNARINALWGTIMAGGAGVEWYFGYKNEHSDLTCQDWRSRELMWNQCQHALDLFAGRVADSNGKIAFHRMQPKDSLVSGENYCLYEPGKQWLVFLKSGGAADLDLEGTSGSCSIRWYNPRSGEFLEGERMLEAVGGKLALKSPDKKDWLAIVQSESSAK